MNIFGAVYPLTIDFAPLVIPFQLFLQKEISFVSSCTATPEETKTMLEFAAKHGIKPVVEIFPMTEEGATQAIDRLNSGKLRYRAVLEVKA
jgi:D-arabinose 1-dehydrogenase-like Zn-dependent alcohol dehydrogenase